MVSSAVLADRMSSTAAFVFSGLPAPNASFLLHTQIAAMANYCTTLFLKNYQALLNPHYCP